MIDHQDDIALPSTIARTQDMLAVRQVLLRQNGKPTLLKGPLVANTT
jgi:hypothetical protein